MIKCSANDLDIQEYTSEHYVQPAKSIQPNLISSVGSNDMNAEKVEDVLPLV